MKCFSKVHGIPRIDTSKSKKHQLTSPLAQLFPTHLRGWIIPISMLWLVCLSIHSLLCLIFLLRICVHSWWYVVVFGCWPGMFCIKIRRCILIIISSLATWIFLGFIWLATQPVIYCTVGCCPIQRSKCKPYFSSKFGFWFSEFKLFVYVIHSRIQEVDYADYTQNVELMD